MRFGLFFQVPESVGQTHAERYAEMFDLIALADSLGFDVAWLAELHFGGAFSLLSTPLMMVPVIAQRTRRIRIGTAVTLLPLHHPLSCAEQAATADLLSGGRLEFGVGRGSIPSQFHGFRVPVVIAEQAAPSPSAPPGPLSTPTATRRRARHCRDRAARERRHPRSRRSRRRSR
jgi:alkanesulfonate monooxygenase SsuD/methylene tetrahydromethanopterin reductase-like flavin-dependent oxidoreductase (luciferase family)